MSERYIRDIERTRREFEELKAKEQQETKRTIMIFAMVIFIL